MATSRSRLAFSLTLFPLLSHLLFLGTSPSPLTRPALSRSSPILRPCLCRRACLSLLVCAPLLALAASFPSSPSLKRTISDASFSAISGSPFASSAASSSPSSSFRVSSSFSAFSPSAQGSAPPSFAAPLAAAPVLPPAAAVKGRAEFEALWKDAEEILGGSRSGALKSCWAAVLKEINLLQSLPSEQACSSLGEASREYIALLRARCIYTRTGRPFPSAQNGCYLLPDDVPVTWLALRPERQREAGGDARQRIVDGCQHADSMDFGTFALVREQINHIDNICFFLHSAEWQRRSEATVNRLALASGAVASRLQVQAQNLAEMHVIQKQQLEGGWQVTQLLSNLHEGLKDVFAALHQIRSFHRYLAEAVGSVQTFAFYFFALFLSLCFTAHARVQAARLPLLLLLLVLTAVELATRKWGMRLFLAFAELRERARFWRHPDETQTSRSDPFRTLGDSWEAAGAAVETVACVLRCMYTSAAALVWLHRAVVHKTPEELLRNEMKKLQKEMQEVRQALCQRSRAAAAAVQHAKGNASPRSDAVWREESSWGEEASRRHNAVWRGEGRGREKKLFQAFVPRRAAGPQQREACAFPQKPNVRGDVLSAERAERTCWPSTGGGEEETPVTACLPSLTQRWRTSIERDENEEEEGGAERGEKGEERRGEEGKGDGGGTGGREGEDPGRASAVANLEKEVAELRGRLARQHLVHARLMNFCEEMLDKFRRGEQASESDLNQGAALQLLWNETCSVASLSGKLAHSASMFVSSLSHPFSSPTTSFASLPGEPGPAESPSDLRFFSVSSPSSSTGRGAAPLGCTSTGDGLSGGGGSAQEETSASSRIRSSPVDAVSPNLEGGMSLAASVSARVEGAGDKQASNEEEAECVSPSARLASQASPRFCVVPARSEGERQPVSATARGRTPSANEKQVFCASLKTPQRLLAGTGGDICAALSVGSVRCGDRRRTGPETPGWLASVVRRHLGWGARARTRHRRAAVSLSRRYDRDEGEAADSTFLPSSEEDERKTAVESRSRLARTNVEDAEAVAPDGDPDERKSAGSCGQRAERRAAVADSLTAPQMRDRRETNSDEERMKLDREEGDTECGNGGRGRQGGGKRRIDGNRQRDIEQREEREEEAAARPGGLRRNPVRAARPRHFLGCVEVENPAEFAAPWLSKISENSGEDTGLPAPRARRVESGRRQGRNQVEKKKGEEARSNETKGESKEQRERERDAKGARGKHPKRERGNAQ
uniref:Putative transmembrane protein n=3 Tax=Toxoplasma gondii TaxID=5811 RepID=A0A2T6IZ09_TOXGO|nr:putative transmembrane protein [Toxoplasma gondii TgCATBr9]